jgi:hypothetical protein
MKLRAVSKTGGASDFKPARFLKILFYLGWVTVAAVAAAHLLYYFPRAVDDMFIYLRYAENLAAGDGLTYNTGEKVEGFSGPLWVALLSIGAWAGVGGVSFAKLVAILFFSWFLVGLYVLSIEHFHMTRGAALAVPLAAALNSYLVSWAILGLETPAYLATIVWTIIFLARQLRAPSKQNTIGVILCAGAEALSRPEAPMFVVLAAAALVLEPIHPRKIFERVKSLAVPCILASLPPLLYLIFRRLYFGLWMPHTYYAKNLTALSDGSWAGLWSEGAFLSETISVAAAGVIAILLALFRKSMAAAFVMAGVLVFTDSVIIDWMPNQRHFLLIWVFVPILLVYVADVGVSFARRVNLAIWKRMAAGTAAALFIALTALLGVQQMQIDSRYSSMDFKTHGRGVNWHLYKTWTKWEDTQMCLHRKIPPHVTNMHPFSMGMITQLYRLIEADAAPLEDSWYIGRDIGRLGFLSPVRVFDTDGLFTPAVVHDPEWRNAGGVSSDLIEWAFDRPAAASELYGSWSRAMRANAKLRQEYKPWRDNDYIHWRSVNAVKPSTEQILARYRYALAKFPSAYYVMTIYGEAVGAALYRRVGIVENSEEASK